MKRRPIESERLRDLLTEASRALASAWARATEALIESQMGEDGIATSAATHVLVETSLVNGGRMAWLVPNGEAQWPPRYPRVEMRSTGDDFGWAVGIVDRAAGVLP